MALDRRSAFRRAVDGLAFVQGRILLFLGYWIVLGTWSVAGKLAGADPLGIRRRQPRWEPFADSRIEDAERQY